VTLQAAPTTIEKGGSITLSWSSTNATALVIAPAIGNVAPEGSTKVSPDATTTYTITATGPGGSIDATASVTVTQPPPPPPPPPQPTLAELFARDVHDAFFDFNKADIRADAKDTLSKDADFIKAHAGIKVTIEGHCDERGSTEYNMALGDRRAAAVKKYLVSLGVSADSLTTVSFGKEKPSCTEGTEDCWQKNRRGHPVLAQ
jgi:peptidoglycan-associated lipoprotein